MSDHIKARSSVKKGANKWENALSKGARSNLSWSDAGAEDLHAAVARVTEDGAAVLLSKTSDGGALLIQVLISRESKPKMYCVTMAELNEALLALSSVE